MSDAHELVPPAGTARIGTGLRAMGIRDGHSSTLASLRGGRKGTLDRACCSPSAADCSCESSALVRDLNVG